MLPSLLIIGFLLGLSLSRRLHLLRWGVVIGAIAWVIAVAVTADRGVSVLDVLTGLILAVINLGLGALIGLYSVRWLGRLRARVKPR